MCLPARLSNVTSQQNSQTVPKINPTLSVCPFYQKHNFQQFCPNQVGQLVLCEHAKSSNRLIVVKTWLYEAEP